MKNRRVLFLVAALLGGGAAAVGLWSTKEKSEAAAVASTAVVPSKAVLDASADHKVNVAIAGKGSSYGDQSAFTPPELTAPIQERAGYTKESSDLILTLMRHPELRLSKSEMEDMLTVYLEAVKQRAQYEAAIAKVEVVSPTERKLTIPSYESEGHKIESEMYRNFASIVGEERAESVENALRAELYFRNYGYGESEQIITVKIASLPLPDVYYDLSHSVATIHSATKDSSGAVRTVNLSVKNAHSLLPVGNLGSYNALVEFFPVGSKS